MRVYHAIEPNSLGAALENGLSRQSRGALGDDQAIIDTDHYLDARCPLALRQQAVSRDDNLYGYACVDGAVIDIADGRRVPVEEFLSRTDQTIIELSVDPRRCFVSDLDTYDAVKAAVERGTSQSEIDRLAKSYWSKLRPLAGFNPATIRRPEIMITYDIAPDSIKLISKKP